MRNHAQWLSEQTDSLMNETNPSVLRLTVLGIVFVSLLASLFARLWYLQAIRVDDYRERTAALHLRTIHAEGPRGRILDRNGRVLVNNKVVIIVGIDKNRARIDGLGDGDPKTKDKEAEIAKRSEVFGALARVLTSNGYRVKETAIEALFNDPRYGPNDFAGITQVAEELELYLGERHEEFAGIDVVRRAVRTYPYGSAAAHILGYVGQINETELKDKVAEQGTPSEPIGKNAKPYDPGDEIGKSGVERSFEQYLRATPGDRVIRVDAKGQFLGTEKEPNLTPGDDLWLTIDIDVQVLAERKLADRIASRQGPGVWCDKDNLCDAQDGAVVVQDPNNGDILAMASFPTFDPALLVNGISTEQWEALNSKENRKPMLNRVVAETYAAGSTFKLFTTHAALTTGFIGPTDVIQDNGTYLLQDCKGVKCDWSNAGKEANGPVDLRKALTVSSDVYYYRIADLMWRAQSQYGQTPIQDSAAQFGLGQKTGIRLPSESAGLVGTPTWLAKVYAANPAAFDHGQWRVGDTLNVSIGQGLTAVTPLQLVNAYSTFANGGTRFEPRIASQVTQPKDMTKDVVDLTNVEIVERFAPKKTGTVAFNDIGQFLAVFEGLKGVTTRGTGTAVDAFNENPTADGWPLAGKTGTAEVNKKADTSVFVGWGPAIDLTTKPQYAAAAVIPQGGFGADAAAPLVFDILAPLSRGTIERVEPTRLEEVVETAVSNPAPETTGVPPLPTPPDPSAAPTQEGVVPGAPSQPSRKSGA